ncbi:MAG: hypothetical protein IPG16_03205 [Comamonadaceae bacterium]|nr:hypothetical protein [Comamonadaceae bacterium]
MASVSFSEFSLAANFSLSVKVLGERGQVDGKGVQPAAGADDVEHGIAGQVGEAADGGAQLRERGLRLGDAVHRGGQLLQRGRVAQAVEHLGGPLGQADAVDGAAHVLADGGQVFGAAGRAVAEGAEGLAARLPIGDDALQVFDEQAAPGAVLG